MADEQVIGVAQLRLEAQVDDFNKGLDEVIRKLDEGENALAQFTEKGEKEGARRLASQQRIDNEILALTGSATQRQLAAVDARTNAIIAQERKRGATVEEIARLEIAAHQRKAAILVAEEKRSQVAIEATTAVTERSHASFGKTQTAVMHLGTAFGGAAGHVGKATTALGHLVMAGLNPVAIATAGLAVTIATVIKKHEEQEAAVKAATAAYAQQRKELFDWQARIEATRAGTNDEAERSLQKQIDQHVALIKTLKDEDMQAMMTGRDQATMADIIGMGQRAETNARMQKIRDLEAETEVLQRQLFTVRENRAETEKSTEAQKQAAFAQVILKSRNEAATKAIEDQTKAEVVRLRAVDRAMKAEQQRAEVLREASAALLDLQIAAAEAVLEHDAEHYEARMALVDLYEERELQSLGEQYVNLLARMAEGGDRSLELEEEIQRKRAEIVERYARQRLEIETGTASSILSLQGSLGRQFSEKEARSIANELYNAGYTQVEIAKRLRDMGIDPGSIGFGQGVVAGPAASRQSTPLERLQLETMPFRGAFIWPGRDAGTTYGPGVMSQGLTVNVNNYSPSVVAAKQAADGSLEITIANDIMNGGEVSRAIEDAYGVQRSGL